MTPSFSFKADPSFPAEDVGLGTAYERLAIYRRILHWWQIGRPARAAEGPLDGMAGMAGLHLLPLARRGVSVTVVLPSQAALASVREIYRRAGLGDRLEAIESDELPRGREFDWVLSFNALPIADGWERYLASITRSAKRLALFVSHPWSYGTWLRRAARMPRRTRAKAELFDHVSTRRRRLERELRALGSIEDRAWVDCPWWPDLFVETGDTLAGSIGLRSRPKFVYDAESFPYAHDSLPSDLERKLSRHPQFESSRLAPIFAHHQAYLVTLK